MDANKIEEQMRAMFESAGPPTFVWFSVPTSPCEFSYQFTVEPSGKVIAMGGEEE